MNCGCSYELFWRLNPRKLKAFYKARELKIKEEMNLQDEFAWLIGGYVRKSIASVMKNSYSYPSRPLGFGDEDNLPEDTDKHPAKSGRKDRLTDGQRFALFMVKHNKALEKQRKRKKQQD